jgi:glycosyltransferase involved in cell wall biosynthesis
MSRPRISIITATFNRSHVLRHTIGTVIAQRFTDWELIVVGDACTDDTREVVAGFADPRIRYHELPVNVGEQSGPNNAGVREARADLLAFLNHDDLWLPDHLEVLASAIERTGADLVFSLMAVIIPGHEPVLSNFTPSGRYEARTVVPASAWLFRRALWARVGPWRSYRESYRAPSQDWLHRAMRAGSDSRLVPAVTVVAFPSGYRQGSYTDRDDSENASYAARIATDPQFRESVLTSMVLGQAAGGQHGLSTTAVRPYLVRGGKNAVSAALSAIGVPPGAVRLFLKSRRRGHFIDSLRRVRGLPALSRGRTE